MIEQLSACVGISKVLFEVCADQIVCGAPNKNREAVVDCNYCLPIANQKPFDGSVDKSTHPVRLLLTTTAVAHLNSHARERENDYDEARERHRDRKQAGGQRCFGDLYRWIGDDGRSTHRGKVVTADCHCQKQG